MWGVSAFLNLDHCEAVSCVHTLELMKSGGCRGGGGGVLPFTDCFVFAVACGGQTKHLFCFYGHRRSATFSASWVDSWDEGYVITCNLVVTCNFTNRKCTINVVAIAADPNKKSETVLEYWKSLGLEYTVDGYLNTHWPTATDTNISPKYRTGILHIHVVTFLLFILLIPLIRKKKQNSKCWQTFERITYVISTWKRKERKGGGRGE